MMNPPQAAPGFKAKQLRVQMMPQSQDFSIYLYKVQSTPCVLETLLTLIRNPAIV